LANNRKHKVIGRTIELTNSTTLKNGAKYQGEFNGSKLDTKLGFNVMINTLRHHSLKASPRLNLKVVVVG